MPTRPLAAALTAAALLAGPAAAEQPYIGAVEVIRGGDGGDTARGRVFLDRNRNSRLDPGEPGVPDVSVSNGREVVRTDAEGAYALPAYDDMNLFVTKPAGYAPPVDRFMVPQFAYVHKRAGSPPLRFGGVAPTGPLPEAVNFPLIAVEDDAVFDCLVFGDAQTYSNRELGYLRETVGRLLAARDNSDTACLIFEGDMMGDDLALFPRFKAITAIGGVPQYFVPGNHDMDLDAADDADSLDTFRAAWGPEYYSFSIGHAHFVVLDNVRYPCNGVDDHPFCALDRDPTYNGVVSARQLAWLRNDLAHVPADRLIVLNAHIPFQSFTDAGSRKQQTDNFGALAALLAGRKVLALSGHTHTVEQLLPGEAYAGFAETTGLAESPFHQIVTGAVSGSWWAGDLDDQGVPHATMRLGAPRGYVELAFGGTDYVDTYRPFGAAPEARMHVGFQTPRFRDWAAALFAYAQGDAPAPDAVPPVSVNDLGDRNLLIRDDLTGGTWAAINVWGGSQATRVSVSINGGPPIPARRTQSGTGEAPLAGPDHADPTALAKQASQGRAAIRSAAGGEDGAGFETWRGERWAARAAQPFRGWMLTRRSAHLWRADLPADLPAGVHVLEARATDRYGRAFTHRIAFEVAETAPPLDAVETLGE